VFDPHRYAALGPVGGLHSRTDLLRAFEVNAAVSGATAAAQAQVCPAPAWVELWRAAASEWQEVRHDA
jgi:hypothetical protein